MRKAALLLLLAFAIPVFLLTAASPPAAAQDKPGQAVTVTAVEIPVRVLHKGDPIKGLAKEDFEVYENGVRQDITGFEVVSLKQYVAPGGPMIGIADFKSGQKAIRFTLKDYARIPSEGKTVGSAAVRITIFNDKSEQVFADGKTHELDKDENKKNRTANG